MTTQIAEPGQLARVRQRLYLVERVTKQNEFVMRRWITSHVSKTTLKVNRFRHYGKTKLSINVHPRRIFSDSMPCGVHIAQRLHLSCHAFRGNTRPSKDKATIYLSAVDVHDR